MASFSQSAFKGKTSPVDGAVKHYCKRYCSSTSHGSGDLRLLRLPIFHQGSSWEVPRVLEEARGLRNVLRNLEELADKAETPGSTDVSCLPALKSLSDPNTGSLSKCCTEMVKLKKKLTPSGWSGPAGSKRRGLVEVFRWPLKEENTDKVLVSIGSFKSPINLAIAADQT
ncbi:hypothetical protein HO133_004174 [Letharia lupina]|uniref:Uncharacterized protein n=1 Tax=Letharia lupina TaxID=560253 RepID=A0A8H6FJW1_9LECA|nr:uncharacterized protein HO133_004174 [Letharia lupina]KAF6229837.1 hypothetical protein HO133_004174 [Letharia lupina]